MNIKHLTDAQKAIATNAYTYADAGNTVLSNYVNTTFVEDSKTNGIITIATNRSYVAMTNYVGSKGYALDADMTAIEGRASTLEYRAENSERRDMELALEIVARTDTVLLPMLGGMADGFADTNGVITRTGGAYNSTANYFYLSPRVNTNLANTTKAHFWLDNNAANTTVSDASTNGYTATLQVKNSDTFSVAGKTNLAFNMGNWTNHNGATFGSTATHQFLHEANAKWTIAFWIKMPDAKRNAGNAQFTIFATTVASSATGKGLAITYDTQSDIGRTRAIWSGRRQGLTLLLVH